MAEKKIDGLKNSTVLRDLRLLTLKTKISAYNVISRILGKYSLQKKVLCEKNEIKVWHLILLI